MSGDFTKGAHLDRLQSHAPASVRATLYPFIRLFQSRDFARTEPQLSRRSVDGWSALAFGMSPASAFADANSPSSPLLLADRQISLMSRRASPTCSIKTSVDVVGHACLDSTQNLTACGPMRSLNAGASVIRMLSGYRVQSAQADGFEMCTRGQRRVVRDEAIDSQFIPYPSSYGDPNLRRRDRCQ